MGNFHSLGARFCRKRTFVVIRVGKKLRDQLLFAFSGGIPGSERLPRFTDLEQSGQALIEPSVGLKKICSAGGSVGHFMGVQIRDERFA